MTRRSQHTLPEFFINDLQSLGWKPIFKLMQGDTGCFTRVHNERFITSFAQLRVPRDIRAAPALAWPQLNVPAEYRFNHRVRLGTTWFKTAYRKISGDKIEYPGFACRPEKHFFVSPKYSQKFIKDASDYMIEWAINIDLRKALLSTADIPEGLNYPNNSFDYITAHAILGNIDKLENFKSLVTNDLERTIAGYVKTKHLEKAIECCIHPEKYGIPETVIECLRGNEGPT